MVDIISTTCWSVWLARKDIMFNRTSMTIDMLSFHPKMRWMMWARVVHDGIQFLEGSYWFCPTKCKSSRNQINDAIIHWASSPHRWSKFIVVGVAKGDEVDCGEVLWDDINFRYASSSASFIRTINSWLPFPSMAANLFINLRSIRMFTIKIFTIILQNLYL